jgi:hypothetical protein
MNLSSYVNFGPHQSSPPHARLLVELLSLEKPLIMDRALSPPL